MALRDWNPFARREGPSPSETSPTLSAALAELERLAADRPELSTASRSLSELLRAAFLVPPPELPLHADPELINEAWRAGVPAFRAGEEPPAIDRDDLLVRVLACVASLPDDQPHAASLLKALRNGSVDPHAWALVALGDRPEAVDEQAETLGLDAGLVRSVLRLALLPVLSRRSQALDAIRSEGLWTRGECPNCGGPATLAESRGLEQSRAWRCGLCAADWAGERLRCPFCGETDHRQLHYQFAEGEQDHYRLALCDSCGGRLPVVSTLTPISAPGLLVAELATLHLTAAAAGPAWPGPKAQENP